MTKLKNIALGFGLLISSISIGQSVSCATMVPICTDAGLDFAAQAGVPAASVTDPGNNYGCLNSSPSPTWYYLEIANDGDLIMSLSAPMDIDFILYGPFADLTAAEDGCGTMGQPGGSAPIVDCSFNGTNDETVEISPNSSGGATTGVAGEVYVLCITNFDNNPQQITLAQTSGDAETDCSIVTACVSNPGTFSIKKNNIGQAGNEFYLCATDYISIESNDDFILPNDTVFSAPAGPGDFEVGAGQPTTAQLMWLVYNQDPGTSQDPTTTPGFLGENAIIPSKNLAGNLLTTQALMNLVGGCGTYWFVPVAGDDGIGNNGNVASSTSGTIDNGGLHWDKNGNGCYLLGEAIKVTFACAITTTPVIACGGANGNSMNIEITGGTGDYTVTNQGAGNLLNTSVPSNAPGIATVTDLVNNSGWSIEITDGENCSVIANASFIAPSIVSSVMDEASDCPGMSTGSVSVTIGTTGTGVLSVTMNGTATTGSPYVLTALAGTLVNTIVTDAEGCTFEQAETITSAGHSIVITNEIITDEACFGDATGTASFDAAAVDADGNPQGSIVSIVWTNPTGTTFPGTSSNTSQTNMIPGNWSVTITDDFTNPPCILTHPIVIGSPDELTLYSTAESSPACFGQNSGSIDVETNGGVGTPTISWTQNTSTNSTINELFEGTYNATATDDNGCTATVEIILTDPAEISVDVNLFKLNIDCHGAADGSIIITDVQNTQGEFDYVWNLGDGYTNPSVSSNIASGLDIGTYEIKISDDAPTSCFKIFNFTITQNDSLYWSQLDITPAVCRSSLFDEGRGQIAAAIARTDPGAGGSNFTYQWTEDATGSQAVENQTTWGGRNTGYYTMVATDAQGCVIDTTIFLDSINPVAAFDISSPQFTSNYVGTAPVEVTFTNNSLNYAFANEAVPYANNPSIDTSMTWNFGLAGDPFQTEIITPLTRTFTSEGLYTVCLIVTENMNHCKDTACIDIQIYDVPVLEAPNVFTPGNDPSEKNNKFFFPSHVIIEFDCTVFDRWGIEVYKFTDITDAWDGTKFNDGSSNCADGVYFYFYTATSSNGTKFSGQGDLQLIRDTE